MGTLRAIRCDGVANSIRWYVDDAYEAAPWIATAANVAATRITCWSPAADGDPMPTYPRLLSDEIRDDEPLWPGTVSGNALRLLYLAETDRGLVNRPTWDGWRDDRELW